MIKTIARWQAYGEPWTPKGGNEELFPIAIQFEDGSKLLVNSKSPTKPPYDVGDQVEVSITGKTAKGHEKGKVKKIDPQGNFHRNEPRQAPQAKLDLSVADILDKIRVKTEAYLVAREIVCRTAGVPCDKPKQDELLRFASTCAYGMVQDGWKPGMNIAKDSPAAQEEQDDIPF